MPLEMEFSWVFFAKVICMVLIIEGILPFISPRIWKEVFTKALKMKNEQIRLIGLISMLLGVFFLILIS